MNLDQRKKRVRYRDIKDEVFEIKSGSETTVDPSRKSVLSGKNKLPENPKMTTDELEARRWKLGCEAGVNNRYHKHKVKEFGDKNNDAKAEIVWYSIASVAIATISLGLAGFSMLAESPWITGASVASAIVSMVLTCKTASSALTLDKSKHGQSELVHYHCQMLWADVCGDLLASRDIARTKKEAEVDRLERKIDQINLREPIADTALFEQCEVDEFRSRSIS